MFDLGYLGVERDFPGQISSLPNKKKNQKESVKKKKINQYHSRKRIVIEHTICRMKKYKNNERYFPNRLRKSIGYQI